METEKRSKPILQQMRELMRRLSYAIHTERTYCDWVIRFSHIQNKEALMYDAEAKVEKYLNYLAVTRNVEMTAMQSLSSSNITNHL